MNTLGLWLMWCSLPATLFALVGIGTYFLTRRAGPAIGALTALTTLLVLSGISVLALSPWPHWWTLRIPANAPPAQVATTDAPSASPLPMETARVPREIVPIGIPEVAAVPQRTMAEPAWQPWLEEMQPERAQLADSASTWHWPAIVGLVFVVGVSLAVVRFALGLWMVQRYRTCSQAITAPAILEQGRQIAKSLGISQPITLRQSRDLGSPVTIGWRRPLVLLPAGWTAWSDEERRVVLAHEMAHIARGDYLTWLLAQLSLTLHFYHPLVHWLVRRLRLEQELAADILGAELSGGRELYLVTLTQMVLRQDSRTVGWFARPFLPSHGTFLKRIELLSESKSLRPAAWSRGTAITLVVSLALLGLAIAGVRMPTGEPAAVAQAGEPPLTSGGERVDLDKTPATAAPVSEKGTQPPSAIAPFDAKQARKHQEDWAKSLGVPLEFTNSLGMKFILIPPGEFTMGGAPGDIGEGLRLTRGADDFFLSQGPQHKVVLTRPFYLGVHEVTQAEYEKVMGKNPSFYSPQGIRKNERAGKDTGRQPVENVSWHDVTEFCVKLSEQEKLQPSYGPKDKDRIPVGGNGYRLPTEAEWECACRAGTNTIYWLGNDSLEVAKAEWVANNSHYQGPTAVGSFKANPFGLYDMHGNVWEWVQDWADPKYYEQFANMPAVDPRGPAEASANLSPLRKTATHPEPTAVGSAQDSAQLSPPRKMCRGGSWHNAATVYCRSSDHLWYKPSHSFDTLGFRVVLSPLALKQNGTTPQVKPKPADDQKPAAKTPPGEKPLTLAELQTMVIDQIRSIRSLHISYTTTQPESFGGKSQDHVWAEQGFKLLKRDVPGKDRPGYATSFDGKRTYQLAYEGEQPAGTNIREEFGRDLYSVNSSLVGWLHTLDHRESIINAIRSPTAKLVEAVKGAPGPTIEVTNYTHEAGGKYGLNVKLVLDRAHGYLPSSITYHEVANPSWRFAYEVDEFVKARDGATGKDRWFPARGRYLQRTEKTGEQVYTTVFHKVMINEPLPNELFVLYADSPPVAPGQEQQALADFEKAYQLEPDQLVKRVPRPYLPGRIHYIKKWWASAFAQSPYETTGTFLPMVYPVQDGKLGAPGFSFVSSIGQNSVPASDLLNGVGAELNLRSRKIEDPDKLLEKKMEGDIVIRTDAPADKVVAAFGQLLKGECGVPVALELRETERTVVMISGRIKPPFEWKPETVLEIAARPLPEKDDAQKGSFYGFMQALGESMQPKLTVLSEIENYPYTKDTVSWRIGVRVSSGDKAQDEKENRALLERLEQQTGLKFTQQPHKFQTIFVKRSE